MSLHIYFKCDHCNFSYLGGYSVGGCRVADSNDVITFYEFHSICKNCLSFFPIYSEDLGYIESEKLCFLLSEGNCCKPERFNKSEQLLLKRRLKRASKTEKRQIKLEQKELSRNAIISKVKSGLPIEVIEKNLTRLEMSELCCPNCNIVGKIVLGFEESEICPKCNKGNLIRWV